MKSIVQSPSASLDVVTPLDRAIGAMLGLACADSLLDRHVHFGDEQLSGLSLLPSAVGWGGDAGQYRPGLSVAGLRYPADAGICCCAISGRMVVTSIRPVVCKASGSRRRGW